MKKALYQNILLTLVVCVLTVPALEWVVRRIDLADIMLLRPSTVPGLAYGFVPNQNVRVVGTRYRINRWGLKGDEIAKEKAAGTFRILFVGDSIVFGQGAKRTDMTRELERRLNAGGGGRRYEAIDTGVPSYSTCQELVYTRDVLEDFSPDLVIVGYAPNDPEAPRTPFGLDLATGRIAPWWRTYHFVKQRLTLVKWAVARLSPIVVRLRGHAYYGPPVDKADEARYTAALHDPQGAYWPKTAECIRGFAEYQKAKGVPVVFAVFPLMHLLDDPRLKEAFARVAATAQGAGLFALDFQQVYAKLPKDVLARIQADGMHPNDEGHELIGAELERALKAQPRLLAGR